MKDNRDNRIAFSPSTEQTVLLHLLAAALGTESQPLTDEVCRTVDWECVAKESMHQTVCPLVFEAASAYQAFIPPKVYERWFTLSFGYMRHAQMTFESQRRLGELLGDTYPFIILKGAAAASYYPQAERRCFGDVDFLIDPTQREAVEALLAADGYERWDSEHICHVVYRKGKEHLEMHFEIAGIPYGKAGERVRAYIDGAERRGREQTVGDVSFPMPSPRDHALILLLHMQHHTLGTGLGLRHLCDWATFVDRTARESFWQTDVLPLLEEIGLLVYAAAMTKTAAIYLHTACPPWAESVNEQLCGGLMEDILTGGNFGCKDDLRAASGMLISENGKDGTRHGMLYNLAHTLHEAVLLQYPIVKKCPILYPFIYVYKAARFCVLCLCGKRPSLTKRLPYAAERKKLYAQLKVFETQDDEVTK